MVQGRGWKCPYLLVAINRCRGPSRWVYVEARNLCGLAGSGVATDDLSLYTLVPQLSTNAPVGGFLQSLRIRGPQPAVVVRPRPTGEESSVGTLVINERYGP